MIQRTPYDGDPKHLELICLVTGCNMSLYLFQLQEHYTRMGRFNIDNLDQ